MPGLGRVMHDRAQSKVANDLTSVALELALSRACAAAGAGPWV